jgi:hypothetical protein
LRLIPPLNSYKVLIMPSRILLVSASSVVLWIPVLIFIS